MRERKAGPDFGRAIIGVPARYAKRHLKWRALCGVAPTSQPAVRGGREGDPVEVLRSAGVSVGKLVAVVDDDVSVRESLPDLLRSFGFEVAPFASAEAFLASDCQDRTSCLILDIAMAGMSGPELQEELIRRKCDCPIVFITAHSDDRIVPRLLDRGAVACLYKPLGEAALLEAVTAALDRSTG
jgi:CheY-like chemotaxis protein